MWDLVIPKGQLASEFKSRSENHKAQAALLFTLQAKRLPTGPIGAREHASVLVRNLSPVLRSSSERCAEKVLVPAAV